MADDKEPKASKKPVSGIKGVDEQMPGVEGMEPPAPAGGTPGGMPSPAMPSAPPPGLNNMEAIINMMMPAAGRLNPQDAMPMFPSIQPWAFKQGPQQPLPPQMQPPLPPQTGMPLPQ